VSKGQEIQEEMRQDEEGRGKTREVTCCKVCVLSSSLRVEAMRVARGERLSSSRVRSSERIVEEEARCGRRRATSCCLQQMKKGRWDKTTCLRCKKIEQR
jgi:hypothetical protein